MMRFAVRKRCPQRLKPLLIGGLYGMAEAMPLRKQASRGRSAEEQISSAAQGRIQLRCGMTTYFRLPQYKLVRHTYLFVQGLVIRIEVTQ